MKKLAIISSYDELCGNATYTEVLRKEFTKHYEVDVLALKTKWLSSSNGKLKALAEQHIEEMAQKLKGYDCVNIQFEAGLYGTYPYDIVRRIKKLVRSSRNIVFTMHRVDIRQSIFDRGVLRSFLSTNFFAALKTFRRQNHFPIVYEKVVNFLKEESHHKNVQIIVHTQRDRDTVKQVFEFDNVYDFPLTFLNKEQLQTYPAISSREEFCQEYGLSESDKFIGLFGFVTDYKSYETAILALPLLPKNYKILLFGSQHPMSITNWQKVNPYISYLMELVENKKLSKRVIFAGSLDDENFIKALYCCDFAVLPYMEVNQGGSGIASLVIETGIKSLFSNNLAFAELKRYFPDCFESFDIGNYHELAYKMTNYHRDYRANIAACHEKYNIENNVLFHKSLFDKADNT